MNDDYLQPGFYHFNEDSLKLVKWIQASGLKAPTILDLGAGSGVIGIELARLLNPQQLTLVEIQEDFLVCLKANCNKFLPPTTDHRIYISSFMEFNSSHLFDMIVCNPPYYLPGRGELAKDPKRAIARSFIIDTWKVLIMKISELLALKGKAFIILKNDHSLFEEISKLTTDFSLNIKKNEIDSNMILELFRLNEN